MSRNHAETFPKNPETVRIGAMSFDLRSLELLDRQGNPVTLRSQSAEVLGHLARHPGKVVPKGDLIALVWPDSFVTDDSLVQCIADIRRALGDDGRDLVQTHVRKGYRLAIPSASETPATWHPGGRIQIAPPGPVSEARALGRPSIAMLPLKNLSQGNEAALFGEAVAEEIIVELARDRSMLVVSRASSFRFDLEQADAAEIGVKLGVRFLLAGSVRVAGDQVRVTAHLVQCDTGHTIWSERHDRALRNIFDVQTDIARTVTATVVGRIAEAEADATRHRPLESLESYSLAAQGTRHFISYSEAGYASAIDCFERATALDPGFARAHGMLALLKVYQRWYFEMRGDVADLLDSAILAVQLDPREAKGHCALGLGWLILRDFDKAGYHFAAGLNANPNDDLLMIEHARYLMYVERPEAGLEQVAEAMRLNPFHPNWYWNIQGRCLHMLGRHEEALQAFQRIHRPNFWIHAYLAACHRKLGDLTAARAARQALFDERPGFDIALFLEIFPYKSSETAMRFFDEMGRNG